MNQRRTFIDSDGIVKRKLRHWGSKNNYFTWLDSCHTEMDRYGNYEFVMGVASSADTLLCNKLAELENAILVDSNIWRFGFLGYDLKGEIEPRLCIDLPSAIEFPKMGFFQADIVVTQLRGSNELVFEVGYSDALWENIQSTILEEVGIRKFSGFQSNFSKQEYCETVSKLRTHIYDGDCYEINLSQCFSAEVQMDSPIALWEKLVEASPVPFAGYCKWEDLHLLCASPERFLRLHGDQIITQPIKGTSRRSISAEADAHSAHELQNSEKERAENVMIVDLSRNDLHRSCEVGTVSVPHIFEIQTFPQVHHLVSTIVGRKKKELNSVQVICNTFPPGSMTGAPKVRSCELIAQYEQLSRGIYAGALGYIAPNGDFDFNVVIRSMVFDSLQAKLNYHVGGAITWDSDPEAEFAETLLKAKAISGLF